MLLKHPNADESDDAPLILGGHEQVVAARRSTWASRLFFLMLLVVSALWLASVAVYANNNIGWSNILQMLPHEIGAFFAGALITSLCQGFMLGMYVMGLDYTWGHVAFAILTSIFLTVGYSFSGATWISHKTDEHLQRKSVEWAKGGIWGLILGIAAISLATPYVSERIFDKWFNFPQALYLTPFPIMSGLLVVWLWTMLRRMPFANDRMSWLPFAAASGLWITAFGGMAYSFYPYVVPDKITIYEAASAPESLWIILIGTCIVLPTILAYTILAYYIFRGKATELTYD